MNVLQAILLGVLAIVLIVSGYAMLVLFGIVGLVTLLVFVAIASAIVYAATGGMENQQSGGGTARASKYDSKGARGER